MPHRRKRTRDDLAGAYSRIRKPVPPAERVEEDRRRKTEKKQALRHIEEELSRDGGEDEDH